MSGQGKVPSASAEQLSLSLLPMPTVYMNGFVNHLGAADITTVVTWGPRPQLSLTMPHSVAKTYARALLELVETYEAQVGFEVPTIQDLNLKMAVKEGGS